MGMPQMLCHLQLPLLLLLCYSPIWVANSFQTRLPTLAIRLTNRGVNFFGSIGHKLVNKELPKTKFPTISLPIDSGPGSGQVEVTDLLIPSRSFQSPQFHFQLGPNNSVQFVSSGGSIPLQGQWTAFYVLAGVRLNSNGWVQVEADNVQSSLALGISSLRGRPQLEVFSCSAEVDQVDVHIGGGVFPWLINLFRSELSAALRQAIHDQFCLTVRSTLLLQLNALLREMPSRFALGDSLFLDYSFDNQTQVTSSFVQSLAFANLLVQNASACPLGPALPMALLPPSQEWMVSVWLDVSVTNCLLWSVHRANLLQMSIEPGFDGGKFAKFLQTSCHIYQLCLGRFFPALSRRFPGQHVDFHFLSASAPSVEFVPSQNATLNLTARFFVDLHISPWKSHPEVLAQLEMNATADFEPILDGGKLKGKLGSLQVEFFELSSSIGNFSEKFLNTFALLAKPMLEAVLQSSLRVGLPLPTIEGIRLARGSRLTGLVRDQLLRLDTDLEYANSTAPLQRMGKQHSHRAGQ